MNKWTTSIRRGILGLNAFILIGLMLASLTSQFSSSLKWYLQSFDLRAIGVTLSLISLGFSILLPPRLKIGQTARLWKYGILVPAITYLIYALFLAETAGGFNPTVVFPNMLFFLVASLAVFIGFGAIWSKTEFIEVRENVDAFETPRIPLLTGKLLEISVKVTFMLDVVLILFFLGALVTSGKGNPEGTNILPFLRDFGLAAILFNVLVIDGCISKFPATLTKRGRILLISSFCMICFWILTQKEGGPLRQGASLLDRNLMVALVMIVCGTGFIVSFGWLFPSSGLVDESACRR